MDEKKPKKVGFMSFFNDPSQIVDSTKFSMAQAGVQFFGLIIFAVIGASITFRFESIRDIANLDYWIQVVVLLFEQLYAKNIGYDLGRSLMTEVNEELVLTNQQIDAHINGVYDENDKEIIKPLKQDSYYASIALEKIMDDDKERLVKKRMKEIIAIFETKLQILKATKRKRYLFPRKIKVAKRMVYYYWKVDTARKYCENQISDGIESLEDRETILAVPDKNVPNFTRFEYVDMVSTQEDKISENTSRYHQRSERIAKAKSAGMKALKNFGMAMIGPAILFGAMMDRQGIGMIAYTVFILLMQAVNGFKESNHNVITIVLYNATNRLKAIQDTKQILPNIIKEYEEKELETKKIALEEELDDLDKDTNTTDIMPNIPLKKALK